MRTIYKFPFSLRHTIEIDMPQNAIVRLVECQQETPTIWAEVDDQSPRAPRQFKLLGTGNQIEDNLSHVASFQMPPDVWHLYELNGEE